jgi:4-amino-4-deoxy-L-arabinose transferase-like glycosyltransferase
VVGVGSLWAAAMTPLMAQEAYYWSYAEHPALSYFDHPPMVAWGIAGGSSLLGVNPLGVRLLTLLWALGTTWCGHLLLRDFGASIRTCVIWALLSLAVPMLAVGHLLANPDGPLVFFWTACMFALWRARCRGGGWWVLAGVAAGGALLSKYTALFLGIGGLLVVLWEPVMRRRLKTLGPWLAVAVAIACFAPVLIWNAQNQWASFLFQTQRRYAAASFDVGRLLQFIGEQLLLLSPFLVVFLPATMGWLWRGVRGGDPGVKWLLAFSLPLVAYMAVNSAYMKVKPNWLMPAFVPLLMAMLLWADRTRLEARRPRLARCVGLGLIATVGVALTAPALEFVPSGTGTSWGGWPELSRRVDHWVGVARRRVATGRVFVFAADYRDASQLAYQFARRRGDGVDRPVVLAQNTYGEPALQYDWWTDPERHVGETAVFVVIRPDQRRRDLECAAQHFTSLEKVESVAVRRAGNVVLRADIHVGTGYRGPD